MADDARAATTSDDGAAGNDVWSTAAVYEQAQGASEPMNAASKHALKIFLQHAHPDIASIGHELFLSLTIYASTRRLAPEAGDSDSDAEDGPIEDGAETDGKTFKRTGTVVIIIKHNDRLIAKRCWCRYVAFIIDGVIWPAEIGMYYNGPQWQCVVEDYTSLPNHGHWKAAIKAFFSNYQPFADYVPGSKRLASA